MAAVLVSYPSLDNWNTVLLSALFLLLQVEIHHFSIVAVYGIFSFQLLFYENIFVVYFQIPHANPFKHHVKIPPTPNVFDWLKCNSCSNMSSPPNGRCQSLMSSVPD